MADGFRKFRVADKRRESSIISSFTLEPVDEEEFWPALPGQYLTLRVPSGDKAVLKAYSISSDVGETGHYRITVKRESAPTEPAGAPDGVGLSWLHDEVETGTEVEIAAPRGHFVLDEQSKRPVVLLSGGVGQTPLLSMLHSLSKTSRDVWYIHACENGDVHAMGREVAHLVEAASGRIRNVNVYQFPTDDDKAANRHSNEGLIDRALLQSLLPIGDYDFYMCGPTPFMVAMYRLLTELGVDKVRIAYEFFGKATSLEALVTAPDPVPEKGRVPKNAPAAIAHLAFLTDPEARGVPDDGSFDVIPGTSHPAQSAGADDVVFARSGKVAQWSGSSGSLLDLAEDSGLSPEFSCRSGICNSRVCKIQEGEVEYFEDPLDPPASGEVLICCARPKGRVVLDL